MSTGTIEPAALPGLAGRIAAALGTSLTVTDMYGPLGGPVYHRLTVHDTSEIPDLLTRLRGVSGPVLELACGSGRLTIPMLAAGHRVTALDLSASLLAELTRRLADPAARHLAQRLETVEADMFELDLGRTFRAAVLGTTTIGLVPPEVRPAFLRRVHDHLEPGGEFVLSLHPPAAAPTEAVHPMTTADAVDFLVEYQEPHLQRRRVAVLHLGREGRPLLLTSTVHTPDLDTLRQELSDAGFPAVEVHPVRRMAEGSPLFVLTARRPA
ncbi:daptide-type RiPP biosynthesis methyltransferase [Kitasatospora sp. NPDC059722]|uniref:daptide-type RiPP biosynthesis methyltransferase n=1 Tax=Kitasatospora sp. NPDC059722 TaxID=3346925 RepID=UPI0036A03521